MQSPPVHYCDDCYCSPCVCADDDFEDEHEPECALMPDGQCMLAGTEHCDWECGRLNVERIGAMKAAQRRAQSMKRALWLWGLIAAIGIVTWIGYVGLQVRGERPADGVVDLIGLAGLAARARYEELKARLNEEHK